MSGSRGRKGAAACYSLSQRFVILMGSATLRFRRCMLCRSILKCRGPSVNTPNTVYPPDLFTLTRLVTRHQLEGQTSTAYTIVPVSSNKHPRNNAPHKHLSIYSYLLLGRVKTSATFDHFRSRIAISWNVRFRWPHLPVRGSTLPPPRTRLTGLKSPRLVLLPLALVKVKRLS